MEFYPAIDATIATEINKTKEQGNITLIPIRLIINQDILVEVETKTYQLK
jgi:hypothetical protein